MQKNELSKKDFKAKPFWEALRKNDIKIEQERAIKGHAYLNKP